MPDTTPKRSLRLLSQTPFCVAKYLVPNRMSKGNCFHSFLPSAYLHILSLSAAIAAANFSVYQPHSCRTLATARSNEKAASSNRHGKYWIKYRLRPPSNNSRNKKPPTIDNRRIWMTCRCGPNPNAMMLNRIIHQNCATNRKSAICRPYR